MHPPDAAVATARRQESDVDAEAAISVRGLTKRYGSGDDAVLAVDDVSFDVAQGTVVGLLGPNGAGKTTLIKSALGLVLSTAGEVTVAGVDVYDEPRRAYERVGAMLEGARNVYWRLTVRENLEFFASLGDVEPATARERHDRLLDQLGLREKAEETVNDLSRGQKQKVSLACTLARGTDVVFLDEPTLGLDVESTVELRREIRRLAAEDDVTVVLSSHDMDVVQAVCDRVLIVSEGEIVADDTVENLIDVFRTRAYRVTVRGGIPDATRDDLDARFDVAAFETAGDTTSFEVMLPSGEAFFDLVDGLRDAGLVPEDVASIDPDLEDVFLEVTESARRER
jgi:ABC-2 type transport system ATP-binding protein